MVVNGHSSLFMIKLKDIEKPQCCNFLASPWSRIIENHSHICGFKCVRGCGHWFVPFFKSWDSVYMDSMEAIRLAGIQYDRQTFGIVY